MYQRDRYLTAVANKLSNWCGKPLAIIAAMAFLFVWTFAILFTGIPVVGFLSVNVAIITITLLMVLLLHNAHNHDIRALQARVDALVADLEKADRQAGANGLSDVELQQVREALKQRADDEQDAPYRSSRDNRPSLF